MNKSFWLLVGIVDQAEKRAITRNIDCWIDDICQRRTISSDSFPSQ